MRIVCGLDVHKDSAFACIGRKSDVRDAAWIAECTMKDLIRGSFVPSTIVQRMRQYNRCIFDLNVRQEVVQVIVQYYL